MEPSLTKRSGTRNNGFDYAAAKTELEAALRGESGATLNAAGAAIGRLLARFLPEAETDLNALRGICGDILCARHGDRAWPVVWAIFEAVRALPHPSPNGVSAHSRFPAPKESGIGNGVVRVWEGPEPAARRFVVGSIVPEGATTIMYGDGGTLKSYLMVFLAIRALTGSTFLGLPVDRQASALYIDAELDEEEFRRRAYRVARGLGLARPPEGLYYLRLDGPLAAPEVQRGLVERAQGCGATLCILDSLTVASYGSDVKEADVMTAVMRGLVPLGTVVAVDHIPRPTAGANLSGYRPFGSVFKYNLARSVVQVIRADSGALHLRQVKSNFGPLRQPLGMAVTFERDRVAFDVLKDDDERLAGIEQHLPKGEQVAHELAQHKTASPEDLAEALGMNAKTVRNHLTALRHQGRAEPVGDGRWSAKMPVPDSRSDRERESGICECGRDIDRDGLCAACSDWGAVATAEASSGAA